MSILEKTLCYGASKSNIPIHDHSNFLYLFKTKPDNENGLSYIKVGMTMKQTLHDRFSSYNPKYNMGLTIYPEHIYYIHTDNIRNRELLIKRVFNKHPKIGVYYNTEYFEGPIELFIKIFQTIGLMDYKVLSKYWHIDKGLDLLNMILSQDINYKTEDYIHINQVKQNCPKCGKEYRDKRSLSMHEPNCVNTKAPVCLFCNETFSCLLSLHNHLDRCNVYKELIIEKEKKQKEELIRQEYENKIEMIKYEYNDTIEMIKNECEQTIQNINKAVSSCRSNKILTSDKEMEEYIQSRIFEENEKWIDKYNSDIKIRDDRILKLEDENHFLRTVVGRLGLLSDIINKKPL